MPVRLILIALLLGGLILFIREIFLWRKELLQKKTIAGV